MTLTRTWDAVVVGAGPAGSIAAHGLARAGAAVLLVDRAVFPRPKVCGCCLNGRALAAIEESGLTSRLAGLRPRAYHALLLRAWRAEAALPLPAGLSVSRERFDTMLIEAAEAGGATLMLGTRAALVGRDAAGLSTVVLEEPRGVHSTVRCRVVIAATGLCAPFTLRALGGEVVVPASRIGASTVLDQDARVPWRENTVNMTVGACGYVGAVRLEDGRWNLAAALDAGAVARAKGVGPVVCDVLGSGRWPVPAGVSCANWRGTPQLSRRPRRVAADGLFVVGDAAGYVEPFTGEGMACALHGGRAVVPLALRAIDRWHPELAAAWTKTIRGDVQRRLALAAVAAWSLRRPSIATTLTSLLSSWPGLAARPIAWLNRPAAARGALT
jgi:flavin-dependent dehydrogenase